MTVDFNNLPCELGQPGVLPRPVDPVDGGSVENGDEDGDIIIIDPEEPPGEIEPTGPTTGSGGGGGGGGGGPSTPGPGPIGPATPGPGQGPGPSTPGGGGGGGGSGPVTQGPAGPAIAGPGPSTAPPGPPTLPAKWKCVTAQVPGGLGTGGTVTRRVCVSGTSSDYTYSSKEDCERNCGDVNVSGIETDEASIPPNSQEGDFIQDYQYSDFSINDALAQGFRVGDSTYMITTGESSQVTPTQSNTFLTIFKEIRDFKLDQALTSAVTNLTKLNEYLTSLSPTTIKESLRKDLQDIYFSLTYPDGRPIPQSKLLKAIKKHIIENTIDDIDAGYISILKYRALATIKNQRASLNIPVSQFGRKKSELIESRKVAKALAINPSRFVPVTANSTRGVLRALKNKKKLDPAAYDDQTSDLLKLWYILPTDINQRVLATASGVNHSIFISDRNTIPVTTSAGVLLTVPVDRIHYTVSTILSSNEVVDVSSQNDISAAYALPSIVEQATLFDVGSKAETIFTVSSNSTSNLELTYGLNGTRPLYYILKIDRSSITDIPTVESIFVRKTKVRYTLETSAPVIENLLKFRVYPWKILTINHQDPILGHFSSDSTYEFVFTNFSMSQFGNQNGQEIFVRRVPELIVILPTDKFNLNFYNGYSRLLDWNVRRMFFSPPPDPRYSKTGLDLHWISVQDTYPNKNIDEELTVYGKKGTFDSTYGILSLGFKNGVEPLPRKKHGFRAAVETASSVYHNYEVNAGLLWSDIYVRMTANQYRSFKIGISSDMINKLRVGEKTGVKLFHNRDDSYVQTTRVLNLRSSTSVEVPILLNKQDAEINKLI